MKIEQTRDQNISLKGICRPTTAASQPVTLALHAPGATYSGRTNLIFLMLIGLGKRHVTCINVLQVSRQAGRAFLQTYEFTVCTLQNEDIYKIVDFI